LQGSLCGPHDTASAFSAGIIGSTETDFLNNCIEMKESDALQIMAVGMFKISNGKAMLRGLYM